MFTTAQGQRRQRPRLRWISPLAKKQNLFSQLAGSTFLIPRSYDMLFVRKNLRVKLWVRMCSLSSPRYISSILLEQRVYHAYRLFTAQRDGDRL
jgi:hypothetical protein